MTPMTPYWSEGDVIDWAWVQLRTGFRGRFPFPIPHVDHPGCAGGTVSTRRWLTRRQANSATVFGIEFLRAVAAVLAEDGIEPVHSWVDQSWQRRACSPTRHRGIMDPYGETNGAFLQNKLTFTSDGAPTKHHLVKSVLPRVFESLPYGLSRTTGKPGQHLVAPFGWEIGLARPRLPGSLDLDRDLDEVVFNSPLYYCGYRHRPVPSRFSSRRRPLDPDDEREPIIHAAKPKRRLKRGQVPAAADDAVAEVRRWGEFLGFTVGPSTVGEWRDDGYGFDRYTVTAAVTLDVDQNELFRRAQPHDELVTVAKGDREPAAPHIHGRRDLARFGHLHFDIWITDPAADGKLVLTVRGRR